MRAWRSGPLTPSIGGRWALPSLARWLRTRRRGSLQEAADDLIVRLLSHAMIWRTAQPVAVSCEVKPDLRWLEFTYELAQIAAGGGDLRARVFGQPAP